MDTLTHALSGALLARATEPDTPRPDQLPRRQRMWAGFWAAAFPDTDFVANVINPLAYLTLHRGVTHSVLMLPMWALGLALFFAAIARRKYPVRAFLGVCALGIGIHIAGDVITAFGTMIFAPLSFWRAQFPTTFILDPYFTAIIVAGLGASLRWNTMRAPAVIGLGILAGYIGFQALLHQRAVEVGQSYIVARGLASARSHAIPQPFSPFNWMVVVEQPEGYHVAYVSLFRTQAVAPSHGASWLQRVNASYRPANGAQWQSVSRYGSTEADAALAEVVWHADVLEGFRRFALFPALYRVDRVSTRTCVWFADLRFALVDRTVPFRYGACRDDENAPWRIFRLVNNGDGEVFESIPD